MTARHEKRNFAARRLKRLVRSLKSRGLILSADCADDAEDDMFCETVNRRACDMHLDDLRAAHATCWPSVPDHCLSRGDGDRSGALAAAAQSLLPSFAGLCAEGGAA